MKNAEESTVLHINPMRMKRCRGKRKNPRLSKSPRVRRDKTTAVVVEAVGAALTCSNQSILQNAYDGVL